MRLALLFVATLAPAQIAVTISQVPIQTIHPDGLPSGWRAVLYDAVACNAPDLARRFDAGHVISLAVRAGATRIPADAALNASREAPKRTKKAIAWRWIRIALVVAASIVGQAEASDAIKIGLGSGATGAILLDVVTEEERGSSVPPLIPVQAARSGAEMTLAPGQCTPDGSLVFAAGSGPERIDGVIPGIVVR